MKRMLAYIKAMRAAIRSVNRTHKLRKYGFEEVSKEQREKVLDGLIRKA